MDELYEQQLALMMNPIIEAAKEAPTSMYQGEHALRLKIQCIRIYEDGYRLLMRHLYRDTLMVILSYIRDTFPREGEVKKRSISVMKELDAIGLPHMAKYITCHKTEPPTFTLDIKDMTYGQCSFVMRALFSW